MARHLAKLGQLDAKKTLFLLCDLQDKFRPGMKLFDPMIKNVSKLVSLISRFGLGIPLLSNYLSPIRGASILYIL